MATGFETKVNNQDNLYASFYNKDGFIMKATVYNTGVIPMDAPYAGGCQITIDQTGATYINSGPSGGTPIFSQVNTGSAGAVVSVFGRAGAITAQPGDYTPVLIGLGSVNDTSDADKPVSTATQTALDAKAANATVISSGTGLTGGGDLTANRTLSLDINSLTPEVVIDGVNDYIPFYDASTGTAKKVSVNDLPSSGGNALTSNPLSQFAATTSAQLAGVISDETGSGELVFATGPTLVAPALGTPSSGVMTNVIGTASGLTAGNVTTNANLTGVVTSTGNTTAIADAALSIAKTTGLQTELDGKITNPMTTGGDVIYGGVSGVPTRLANGTAGRVLQSNGTTLAPTWETPSPAGTNLFTADQTQTAARTHTQGGFTQNINGAGQWVFTGTGTNDIRIDTDGNQISVGDGTFAGYLEPSRVFVQNATDTAAVEMQSIGSTDATVAFYWGAEAVDGSWRMVRVGANLETQLRVAGVWTVKSTVTP